MAKKTTKTTGSGPTSRLLVEKYLKKQQDAPYYYWINQSKIAKRLIETYGEQIWKYINLGFFLNTLKWFDGDQGKKEIETALKKVKQLEKTEVKIELREDIVYERKTKKTITFEQKYFS